MLDRLLSFIGFPRSPRVEQPPRSQDLKIEISSRIADLEEQLRRAEGALRDLDGTRQVLEQDGIDLGEHQWDRLSSRKSQLRRQIDVVSSRIIELEEQRNAIEITGAAGTALPAETLLQIQRHLEQAQMTSEQTSDMTNVISDTTTEVAQFSRESRREYGRTERGPERLPVKPSVKAPAPGNSQRRKSRERPAAETEPPV